MKKKIVLLLLATIVNVLSLYAGRSFSYEDVEYWVGEGSDRAVVVIDWNDGLGHESLAWGIYFEGNLTGKLLLETITAEDTRLSMNETGGFLNDILFEGRESHTGIGGTNGFYWSTWSKSDTTSWEMNMGLSTIIENNHWFGCSFTDFNPAVAPGIPVSATGPFAPPPGFTGSTAIHADSNVFIGWASGCSILRGYVNISDPGSGFASYGEETDGTGKADNVVVSLGDAGEALLTFDPPIADGPGADFAVFENGFGDYFLELAFVEVSSDGTNFFRFPSLSYTQTNTQLSGFDSLMTENIHNIAGKFRAGFGTPFDLAELEGNKGLDTDSISFVKLVDVVGSIDPDHASYDSEGRPVNDPWPTPFSSSGFDLDAVGVINKYNPQLIAEGFGSHNMNVFPIPAGNYLNVEVNETLTGEIILADMLGNTFPIGFIAGKRKRIGVKGIPEGIYVLIVKTSEGTMSERVIIKH